ncbi:Methyltransferase domain-containing protein [Alkalithermobacter thermoalcaliphilus JW-YL-7 = DSM 7308]|uniref:Methyltransferase domain-containing protein n=1 Tax=Alkalithermobacter thermoalcaliphilus JW-YL-7 = DSM 7308 TaxID=1121328 RepID=A0A150FNG2_CLOPD|nr:Methyltransferase domain containing protein [[Clostridium] paradoxum JW-YL-7 = DSM 7308]SHK92576.1 Methyltransferase domain-containing protein [[Clostridium] paradoxum JW-YL-7 = DSM 7308]
MNKQSISKLKLFFMGLKERSQTNKDFFKSIEVIYKSGLKEFKGFVTIENDKYKINFKGTTNYYTFDELLEYILKESENYESIKFKYIERGTIILIQGDNKGVNIKYLEDDQKEIDTYTASQIKNRNYYVKVGPANDVLKEIGILTKEGKIKNDKIRKYNQIDHFVELIDKLIKELENKDTITILDCACGKSYLSFVLNYYIKEVLKKNCYFIGIDYSDNVINASKKMAENLGYKNMKFIKEDLNHYIPDTDIDIVISLHACDTATDMALGLGVRCEAKAIIVVPCCHKELLNQYKYDILEPILKHGVFKARFADLITDGLRSLLLEAYGYDVSVVEYISPLDTPKNLMIRAVKKKNENKKALDEYYNLKKMFNVDPSFEKLVYKIVE